MCLSSVRSLQGVHSVPQLTSVALHLIMYPSHKSASDLTSLMDVTHNDISNEETVVSKQRRAMGQKEQPAKM